MGPRGRTWACGKNRFGNTDDGSPPEETAAGPRCHVSVCSLNNHHPSLADNWLVSGAVRLRDDETKHWSGWAGSGRWHCRDGWVDCGLVDLRIYQVWSHINLWYDGATSVAREPHQYRLAIVCFINWDRMMNQWILWQRGWREDYWEMPWHEKSIYYSWRTA